jgi:hypothetical protein
LIFATRRIASIAARSRQYIFWGYVRSFKLSLLSPKFDMRKESLGMYRK